MDLDTIFDKKLDAKAKDLLHHKIRNDFIGLNQSYDILYLHSSTICYRSGRNLSYGTLHF